MKVILLQDVEKLGKKYDLKEVKDGYARNFLLPGKLARPATKEALKWLENQKELIEKEAEEDLKKSQELASKLDGLELSIAIKIGEEGQLFESITSQKILEKLKEMGFEVKKSQISLEKPIKELGEFPVKINLDHNLEIEIKLIVTEEK
ncbi:MAG: 50S ribosomal protein L9 [Candidatus Staskawiczbacteria bacterium RIFOXYC1_FULL_37_43]|nr:MAG: 50S ribosomal protein L9 [Candidatus Staskawiczbacteria bacterium RIFCSPHIGHO2_01_FULL_37_17]OGZ71230.1 MAG: 50S ribosomal protein L9 [Candidatus Staskawiczbacteria bacterium RIFCSPLOWO2_01_FULL_37_19]OGZ75630.1 MAG: 50S ribosomal protein L9 [Candidatus Staskawiczbacteria bacterium RIFOXYA1_FULL_37_15]OGZ76654.1 MAG: 50S ribosomal protein L9 [Candidatus Staskawiczbacteria bacterium RIFOXYA12_FULL_37_10]OGZ79906.1 MAG: 50S ribosomal protein L9 [Candidatus Staskawiczbacteria bacterium RIF